MNNYIISTYTKVTLTLTPATVERLKKATPAGCSFENYTFFDLLTDLITSYSWKLDTSKIHNKSLFRANKQYKSGYI